MERTWPASVAPLDRAILDLLGTLPSRWQDYDPSSISALEHKALILLQRAGLVEQRLDGVVTMNGHAGLAEFTVVTSGEDPTRLLSAFIKKKMPAWVDPHGRFRGEATILARRVQVRLSAEGEIARHVYQNQTPDRPSFVCAFVQGHHIDMKTPRGSVMAEFRVESCHADSSWTPPQPDTSNSHSSNDAEGSNEVESANPLDLSKLLTVLTQDNELTISIRPKGSEGKASASASEPQHDPGHTPTNKGYESVLAEMKSCVAKAGRSLLWVEENRPDLSPPNNANTRYCKAQWEYIKENETEIYPLDNDNRSTVPGFLTWSRYVREFLRQMDGPRNSARAGRPHGRSIVGTKDLDSPRQDLDD